VVAEELDLVPSLEDVLRETETAVRNKSPNDDQDLLAMIEVFEIVEYIRKFI
jgi:hypothetical protein